jgi:hypothetical protein
VTVHFSGHVTEIEQGDFNALPPFSLSDPFAGKYVYDDTVQTDIGPFPWTFLFGEDHPISLEVTVGGYTYFLDGNPFPGEQGLYRSAIQLFPNSPLGNFYLVGVVMGAGDVPIFSSITLIDSVVELPVSGVLGDARVPSLPDRGGDFVLVAHPDVLVSPERIVPGIEPGGIGIFTFVNGQRVQVATRFPAVYAKGSRFAGTVTSLTVPGPGAALLLLSAALAMAGRRRPRATLHHRR